MSVNWRMDTADAANVQKQNLNVPACAVAVATVNVIRPRMAAILEFVSVNLNLHNSQLNAVIQKTEIIQQCIRKLLEWQLS